ncbi:MAG: DUF3168 domain-containing protein [Methanothrix sp.]|nr:DUF3168 domain-containing protein [Methanothrix sp.]
MITGMIRSKLLATSAVTDIVSTRIYVDDIPDPATLPAISISKASFVPNKEVGKKKFERILVSCWAEPGNPKNPAVVESVAAAVRAVFDIPRCNFAPYRLTSSVSATAYDVTSSHCRGGFRLIDPTTGWYHIPVDLEIDYNEV